MRSEARDPTKWSDSVLPSNVRACAEAAQTKTTVPHSTPNIAARSSERALKTPDTDTLPWL